MSYLIARRYDKYLSFITSEYYIFGFTILYLLYYEYVKCEMKVIYLLKIKLNTSDNLECLFKFKMHWSIIMKKTGNNNGMVE